MTPELRALIYGTIASVIAAIILATVKVVIDKIASRKTEPIDRGKKITELADAVVDVSTAAVVGIRTQLTDALADLTTARGELDSARAETRAIKGDLEDTKADLEGTKLDLEAARLELRETKRTMERREQDHRGALGRLRNRIAQLVHVLEVNNLEVPPPVEEIDLDLDGDPTAVPA